MRSDDFLRKPEWSCVRSLYKSMGMTDYDIDKPLIGIANAWSELVPGHKHLRELAVQVKYGILQEQGYPLEFGVIGACDGIANGHSGMNYILPTREIIADGIECMVEANRLDGLVIISGCDKTVPGMIMGAVRLDIPVVMVTAGPMLGGMQFDGRQSDNSTLPEALAMLKRGELDKETYGRLENEACPTVGSCSFLGTANTMACFTEALGLSLPGSALSPAVYAERSRIAQDSGVTIMNLVRNKINIKQIITKQGLCNAFQLSLAIGGSTNVVLHTLAIAHSAGLDLTIRDLAVLCDSTPIIAQVYPSNNYNVIDLYHAGGVPVVMKHLLPLLDTTAMTVSGKTIEQVYKSYQIVLDKHIIRCIDSPFLESGGIAILYGNLAPESAVTKPSVIHPSMYQFRGPAKCFDSEETAENAIMEKDIKQGDVLVIRYEGPKGGPGMREMARTMKLLYGAGLSLHTALITDGRFSGSNNGCFIGHISPEASEGGPIALIQDGDIINIDIEKRSIEVEVNEQTLEQRRKKWSPVHKSIDSVVLRKYSKYAVSAGQGAVIE